jgi:hypothetical protein
MKSLLLVGLLSATLCAQAAQTTAEKCKPLTQKERIMRAAKTFFIYGGLVAGILSLTAIDAMLFKDHPIARSCIIGSVVGLCTAYDAYQKRKGCHCPSGHNFQCKDATQTTSC